VNEVRSLAADIAVEAARSTIAAKVDAKAAASLFESSLQALKSKLN
jgi:F-type H+-transporting ATPase subunit b